MQLPFIHQADVRNNLTEFIRIYIYLFCFFYLSADSELITRLQLSHVYKNPLLKKHVHTKPRLLGTERPSSVQCWPSYRSSCHSSVSPFTKHGSFSSWQYVARLTFTVESHGIKRRPKRCSSAWHFFGSVPSGQIILTANFWKIYESRPCRTGEMPPDTSCTQCRNSSQRKYPD